MDHSDNASMNFAIRNPLLDAYQKRSYREKTIAYSSSFISVRDSNSRRNFLRRKFSGSYTSI